MAGMLAHVRGAHLVVVLAGVLGAALTLSALRSADSTTPILVLARDVPADNVVSSGDLTITRIHGDANLMAALFEGIDARKVAGQIWVNTLRRGEPLRRSDVRRAATADRGRTVSFSVDVGDAVNGALHTGDRIDVIGVTRDGSSSAYVLTNARVIAIDSGRTNGPLRSSTSRVTVTVGVDAQGALRLVAAQAAGRVVLVNATGAAPAINTARYEPNHA